MGLITASTRSKKLYTLVEDIVIVTKKNEGMSTGNLVAYMNKCGFNRSEPSLTYRITRVLKPADSFEELHETGNATVTKATEAAGKLMEKASK